MTTTPVDLALARADHALLTALGPVTPDDAAAYRRVLDVHMPALLAAVEQLRAERDRYRAAWHNARARARQCSICGDPITHTCGPDCCGHGCNCICHDEETDPR